MEKYWGEQTELAINNFGRGQLPIEIIRSYAEVKKSCVTAVMETENGYSQTVFNAIICGLDEIIDGRQDAQFPLNLRQGGAGTSINMNLNEVAASLANKVLVSLNCSERVDPIADINRYQSTNDTFTTALTIVLYRKLELLETRVIALQEQLIVRENEFDQIVMAGRTEMQNALPITLGQVFGAWAGAIERDRWRVNKLKERLRSVALGGTAIGTCFFAPKEYVFAVEKILRRVTGLPLSRSQNLPDEISNADKYSELANGIKLISDNLYKITGDLLLYTSSFINELVHPVLQYGSTIMPAKNNPVILELVRGNSIDISCECVKIGEFCKNGQLQLNAYLPFILNSFLSVFDMISVSIDSLINKFLYKLSVNTDRIDKQLVNSGVLINVLLPVLGYSRLKEVYLKIKDMNIDSIEDYRKILKDFAGLDDDKLEYFLNPINGTRFLKKNVE